MHELVVPQLGTNDEQVRIVRWLVDWEEEVSAVQEVAELETSKAVFRLESEYAGFIYQLAEEGEMAAVGSSIAVILDEPDAGAALLERDRHEAVRPQRSTAQVQLTARASRLAEEAGLDISTLPTGRVIRETDVQAAIEASIDSEERPPRATEPIARIDQAERDPVRRVAVYGASQGGIALMATLAEIGGYQVCGFLDDTPGLAGQELAGVPVWSGDEMSGLVAAGIGALATHIASDTFRLELRERAKAAGLTLLNVVHPAAVLAPSVRLGIGNVIKAGAIVDAHVRIGDCCIIDNGAIVPHNNVLGDGCHLAPGVRMGGDCLIGDTTLVGVGAIVTSRVRIGSNAIISPGAVVMGDVGEDMVVAGVPARVIGNRR